MEWQQLFHIGFFAGIGYCAAQVLLKLTGAAITAFAAFLEDIGHRMKSE